MEANLGDFWWVLPLGAFIGTIIYGYTRGRTPAQSSTMHGAAIISSESAQELTAQVSRLADAVEAIAKILKHDSDEAERLRKDQDIADLRKEIERLKRG